MSDTGTDAKGRGRPRPEVTLERDAKVLDHLKNAGPQTRKQIVEATGILGNEVYLSLYRLKRDGEVSKSGGTWSAGTEVVAVAE